VDPRIRNLECFGTGFSDVRTPNGAREVRWRQMLSQHNGHIDGDVGKRMLADTFDTYLGYIHPSSRTICAHSDVDPCHFSGLTPFTPFGSVDGKVATSADIKALNLWARCGRADGTEFDAEQFLQQHPQWDWQRGYLKDRPQATRGRTSSRAAPAGPDRACLQMPQLRAGGAVRGAAVPDVRHDGRLPPTVGADGVRTVANAHSGRPWLGPLRTLGAGLQLVDRRRLRIRPLLRRQFRARGTRAR